MSLNIILKENLKSLLKISENDSNKEFFKGNEKYKKLYYFPFKRFNEIDIIGGSLKNIMIRFNNLKQRTFEDIKFDEDKNTEPKLKPPLNIEMLNDEINYDPLKWEDNEYKEIKIQEMSIKNPDQDDPIKYIANKDSEYYTLNLISDYFHELQRLKCHRYNKKAPLIYFKEKLESILKKKLQSVLKYYKESEKFKDNDNEYKKYVTENFLYLYREICYEEFEKNAKECTQFKPSLMVDMINFLFKDREKNIKVLDFSAGWGDRLIAALTFAEKDLQYLGFDPNTNLKPGYEIIKNTFLTDDNEKYKKNYEVRTEKFETAEIKEGEENSFDLVFTSPPYFKLEIYTNQVTQSHKQYKEEKAWLEGFMYKSIEKINKLLKNYGYLVLIIQNYGIKSKITKYVENIHLHIKRKYSKSFKYKGLITYKTGKIAQPIWVWQKKEQEEEESNITFDDDYSENEDESEDAEEKLEDNFTLENAEDIPNIKDKNKNSITFLDYTLKKCNISTDDINFEIDEYYTLDNGDDDIEGKNFYKLLEEVNNKQKKVFEKYEKEKKIFKDLHEAYDIFNKSKKKEIEGLINGQNITNAWIKIYELLNNYKLLEDTKDKGKILHFDNYALPGSFILAINHYIKTNINFPDNFVYDWKASSLIGEDKLNDTYRLVTNYSKHWLIDYEDPNSGNVISKKNQEFWREYFKNNDGKYGSVDLYTSDVGFEKITTYKNKEIGHLPLNIGQILAALLTLKEGGSMIVKQYTFFESLNISLYAILTNVFEEVHISKPVTSRPTNTETYIIGKNYIGYEKSEKYINILFKKIEAFENEDENDEQKEKEERKVLFPLVKKDLLNPDFLKSIYYSANEIYKRQVYFLYNRYLLLQRFNNNISNIKSHLREWKEKIYNDWIEKNIKQDGNIIKLILTDDNNQGLNVLTGNFKTVSYLELGDIIEIKTEDGINNGIFIIKFIDNNKLILKSKNEVKGEDKIIERGKEYNYDIVNKQIKHIKSIDLLSRFEKNINGFAKQNKLNLNTRIGIFLWDNANNKDIEIYGIIKERRNDVIGVEIQNIEEDSKQLIYIDFKYQGIPDDIKKIVIYESKLKSFNPSDDTNEVFTEYMEKTELSKVYTITEQLDDLYNNILSSYGENNYKVKNETDIQVKRFAHLLEEYGKIVDGLLELKVKEKKNIPLIESIYSLSENNNRQYKAKIKWLIPTVTLKKIGGSKSNNLSGDYNDIVNILDEDFIEREKSFHDDYNKKKDIWRMNYSKELYIK